MKTRLFAACRIAVGALIAGSGAVGLAHAQQKIPTSSTTTQQSATEQLYETGLAAVPLASVNTWPGHVAINRYDGVPIRVAAAPGGGLMIDLGVMKKTVGADGKFTENVGKAHTIVKVPMDFATMSVTVSSATVNTYTITEFEDQHGHHLSVHVAGPKGGPGGSF